MTTLRTLINRNVKLYFKDRAMFLTSLITPLILLVLFATFLGNVYHDSFVDSLPENIAADEKLIDATVGGELISSLLAVSAVTVTFCCNMISVQDKANGTRRDFEVSPVGSATLSLSYYLATVISSLTVCFTATLVGLVYLYAVGWYMTVPDVILIFLDVFLVSMFGTALSSLINIFLSTQGQLSAVSTIVSSVYGFVCGAYMPISSFGTGLQKVISFLPGTYGTSLVRQHCLKGVFSEMKASGYPSDIIEKIKDAIDCNLYFFGEKVSPYAKYLFLVGSTLILICVFILLSALKQKKKRGC